MSGSRVVIVDDHPLVRDALSQTLTDLFRDMQIAQAGSLEELTKLLETEEAPDLVLLDLTMPDVHGFSGLMFLRAQYPEIPVVIVSGIKDPVTIRRCLELNASGYITKNLPKPVVREALQKIMEGGVWTPPGISLDGVADPESVIATRMRTLTPQQMRVLMMLAEGLLNKQIAYKLDVSEATVKAHVSAILQKLAVDSRTQAVITLNKLATNEPKMGLEG